MSKENHFLSSGQKLFQGSLGVSKSQIMAQSSYWVNRGRMKTQRSFWVKKVNNLSAGPEAVEVAGGTFVCYFGVCGFDACQSHRKHMRRQKE